MKRWGLACAALLLLLSGCGPEPSEQVDARRIQQATTVLCEQFGSRVTGSAQEREACDWLEKQLQELGFSREDGTLERESFQGLDGLSSENLTAVCNPGVQGPIWCVVSHYDSIKETPGARDNASGPAILLELARNLGTSQPTLKGEIRLVFLGSEENGYYGSRAYLEQLTPEELARHAAVFNMDISAATEGEGQLVCCTLGGKREDGYSDGDFLEPAENAVSRSIDAACRKLYDTAVPTVHGGESDHVTFHQWEIDCANVCWRRVEDGLPVLPPEYHGEDDIPGTIDYETAAMTGQCVLEALRLLAG